MKKTVFEDLIDGGNQALPCQQFGIGDGFALEIFQFCTLDEFHHQQVLRAKRFINLWNINIGPFARMGARDFHVARFSIKIELAEQVFFDQANVSLSGLPVLCSITSRICDMSTVATSS